MATHPSQLTVDMELKKAFDELHNKMLNTKQQLKISDAQIERLKQLIVHSKLVDQEISILPENTRTYEGVGRMFILQSVAEVKVNLDAKRKTAEEKIGTILTNKVYLENSIKESEDNLRELVITKKQLK